MVSGRPLAALRIPGRRISTVPKLDRKLGLTRGFAARGRGKLHDHPAGFIPDVGLG